MASAIEYWKKRVEAHHAQSLKAQGPQEQPADFWKGLTSQFTNDPHRTDDPVLNKLLMGVTSNMTVLDVGGGAGRFALPLALHCEHITVVEPSESMVAALRAGAKEAGIENLSIVQNEWQDASVDPADTVLCAHVLYGTAEIEPFLRKLDSHARERVKIVSFMDSPMSQVSPLWEAIHNEQRINLPALPEMLNVLWEMDIYPDVEMVGTADIRSVPNRDDAVKMLRKFLYVKPDTEMDARLQELLDEHLEETPTGLVIKGSRPRRQALVSWVPK